MQDKGDMYHKLIIYLFLSVHRSHARDGVNICPFWWIYIPVALHQIISRQLEVYHILTSYNTNKHMYICDIFVYVRVYIPYSKGKAWDKEDDREINEDLERERETDVHEVKGMYIWS